jgi:large subunit ribosomal protein L1
MAKRSKAYEAAAAKIDAEKFYAPFEAVTLAKDTNPSKFDATVEVAFRLGVDPRKADQMVRGTVNLPHGTGKTARVLVFATGRSPPAGPTSMPPSPPLTSWARLAASVRSWVRVT